MNEDIKEKLYGICHELKITPMRTIIILIQLFVEGKINSMEVISKHNSYYEGVREDRLKNLKENRVSGNIAHEINQKGKSLKIKPMPKSLIKEIRKVKVALVNTIGK